MQSTLVKSQKRTFRKDFTENGKPVTLIATVRFDDDCGNGHNTFSMTGERYEKPVRRSEETIDHKSGKRISMSSCGCLHDDIAKHFPELAPLLKWHLCSTDGPMHYIANTVYNASDTDCYGYRAGEQKRDKAGNPLWMKQTDAVCPDLIGSDTRPTAAEIPYVAVLSEGKLRDLDAARYSAIWPDATDEELMASDLQEILEARLPALLEEFRAAVESLGMTW